MDIDDLLGPVLSPTEVVRRLRKARTPSSKKVDDLLGPAKPAARNGKRKYVPLKPPRTPRPDGIFAAREAKGRNLGRTCLICKDELKHKRGRPPIICRKPACFRAYRNLYRHEYDRARPS